MKMTAYFLAVVCVIVAMIYFILPGGSLPTFLPGYFPGSDRVHMLHGFAAVIAAIVFLLIGFSTRR